MMALEEQLPGGLGRNDCTKIQVFLNIATKQNTLPHWLIFLVYFPLKHKLLWLSLSLSFITIM